MVMNWWSYRPTTYVQLASNSIVFLEDDVEAILERRVADAERERPVRSAEKLAVHQHTAKEAAFGYGAALGIPCAAIGSGDHTAFEECLLGAFE